MWERWRFIDKAKPSVNVVSDADFYRARTLVRSSPLWLVAIDTEECLLAVVYEPAGHAANYLYIRKGEAKTS